MEQMLTGVLGVIQLAGELQMTAKPAEKTERTETDSFRDLMDRRESELNQTEAPKAGTESKTPVEDSEKPVDAKVTETVEENPDAAAQVQAVWAGVMEVRPQIVQAEAAPETQAVETQLVTPVVTEANVATAEAEVQVQQTLPETQVEQVAAEAPQVEAEVQVETQKLDTQLTQVEAEAETKVEVKTVEVQTSGENTADSEGDETDVTANTTAEPLFKDAEKTHIKVGEAPAAEETAKPQSPEQQLAGRLVQAFERGETKVVIQLTPENLGKVQVELTRSGDGALQILISADNAQTRGLLEKHSANLQSLLAANTQETVQVEVQGQQESQGHDSYDGRDGNAQDEQQRQRERRDQESASGQDFIQQLRLGLIPVEM